VTIKELKLIIENLDDKTPVLISSEDIYEVETIMVEYHSDGRSHFILSSLE
jgi:hypothetical protein